MIKHIRGQPSCRFSAEKYYQFFKQVPEHNRQIENMSVLEIFTILCSGIGWLLFFCSLLCAWYIYKKVIWRDPNCVKAMAKIEGPKAYPILGSALELAIPNHKIIDKMMEITAATGRVAGGWFFNQPYIFVGEATVAEKILSSTVQIEKSKDYKFLESWLGTGLLTSKGKKWHGRRKLLTPTFHFKILEDFVDIFNEQSDIMIKVLEERADSLKACDIFPFVARCTLDVICESAMGEKMNAQTNSDSEYVNAVYDIGDMFIQRVAKPWFRIDFLFNLVNGRREQKALEILHGFTESVIRKRKSEIRKSESPKLGTSFNEKRRLAFLDLLLEVSEDGKVLKDLDVREETDTFMFEGQDTTATSISWTIFLLASNPECQERLREELFQIFGNEKNRTISQADLSQMKYLECCIKESLRLYPSVSKSTTMRRVPVNNRTRSECFYAMSPNLIKLSQSFSQWNCHRISSS